MDVQRSVDDFESDARRIFLSVACWLLFLGMLLFSVKQWQFLHRSNGAELDPYYFSLSRSNLRRIGLALGNYYDDYRSFPPAVVYDESGRALHSWRSLLLPYLDERSLASSLRYDESWSSPANSAVITAHANVNYYTNAVDRRSRVNVGQNLGMLGPGGLLRKDRPITVSEVGKPMTETVAAIMVPQSNVRWAEPVDVELNDGRAYLRGDALDWPAQLQRTQQGWFWQEARYATITHVLMADGSVYDVDIEKLKAKWELSLEAIETARPDDQPSQSRELAFLISCFVFPFILSVILASSISLTFNRRFSTVKMIVSIISVPVLAFIALAVATEFYHPLQNRVERVGSVPFGVSVICLFCLFGILGGFVWSNLRIRPRRRERVEEP